MSGILWQKQISPNLYFYLKAQILSLTKDGTGTGFTFLIVEKTSAQSSSRNNILSFVFFPVKMRVCEKWSQFSLKLKITSHMSVLPQDNYHTFVVILPILSDKILPRQVLKGWYVIKFIHFNSLSKLFLVTLAFFFHCACVVRKTICAHAV